MRPFRCMKCDARHYGLIHATRPIGDGTKRPRKGHFVEVCRYAKGPLPGSIAELPLASTPSAAGQPDRWDMRAQTPFTLGVINFGAERSPQEVGSRSTTRSLLFSFDSSLLEKL
jgi:hypothetical protein